jgi:hypothetical protein
VLTTAWKQYGVIKFAVTESVNTSTYFTSFAKTNEKTYDKYYRCTTSDKFYSAGVRGSEMDEAIYISEGKITTFRGRIAPILEKMSGLVMISARLASADDVQNILSIALGYPITFIPAAAFEVLRNDGSRIQNMPIKDFLSFIAEYGEIWVGNVYVNNLILLKKEIAANPETKFSFNLFSPRDGAKLLEFLTGQKVALKEVRESVSSFIGEGITIKELANKLLVNY